MASNTPINISNLDFDTIKESLKTYLKSQDQFRDYDFEGSGLSVLLDILAYNTHQQAYYANMVANETFIDSALLKSNVVSIAKHLDYTPKSYKSSVAYVDVEYYNVSTTDQTAINNGNFYLSAGSRFLANSGSRIFSFVATDDTQVKKINSKYYAKNVEIKEGSYKSISYVFNDNTSTNQKFVLPDINIDTDSITVRVTSSLEDNTGINDLWTVVTDLNKLNSASKVFFLQQNGDLNYEIYFGDDILGQKPSNGNVIIVNYRICSGSIANGLGKNEVSGSPTFTFLEYANSNTSLVLDSNGDVTPTFGGSESEEIASIKYYAPRNYQAQERAVTAEDYRTLLAREYGEQAESVYVWGGEDNDPPIYGKVFISIKPKNAEKLSQLQKLAIAKNILKQRNLVSIIPEVIDPDYLYLILDINIKYDSSKTNLTSDSLSSKLKTLIYTYASDNIGKFDSDFVYSLFTSYINDVYNPPVISSSIDLQLQKKLTPNLESITTYSVSFDNELYHPIDGYDSILSSTSFGYQDSTSTETTPPNVDAYLDDDGNGIVRIYKLVGGEKIYLNKSIGTINYTTGKINLTNFAPQYLANPEDTDIILTVIPREKDIASRRNQILIVSEENITVTSTPLTLRYDPYKASGSSFIGNN